jgi:hypothetical protein
LKYSEKGFSEIDNAHKKFRIDNNFSIRIDDIVISIYGKAIDKNTIICLIDKRDSEILDKK